MLVRADALTKYVATTADGQPCKIVDLLFDEQAWVLEGAVLGCEESEGTPEKLVADVGSIDVNDKVMMVSVPEPAGPAPSTKLSFLEKPKCEERPEEQKLGYLLGFRVEASDEWYLGQIADALLDSETREVRYLEMVGPGSWWQGVPKLLPPSFVVQLDRDQRKLVLRVAQKPILNAPAYNKKKPIERDYEARLFAHYGERPYW